MNPTKRLGRSWRGFATPALCVMTLVLVSWTPCQASDEGPNNRAHVNASTDSGEYRLAPGDKLNVIVFDQPQLSGDFTVNDDGQILLPLAGGIKVGSLSLAEAQQRIQEQFADGILVHPTISIRVAEYRPIFVTGYVRKPGNYPFIVGASLKAAIVVAGGLGEPGEEANVGMSEAIMAKERVRQLETNRLALLVRKARLKAQRDEAADFVTPQLVGFDASDVEFRSVYSAENDAFQSLVGSYQDQLKVLKQQRPRIEAEIDAVNDQIAKERERLNIVSQTVDEYQDLTKRGLVRKPELTAQQIAKALVQAEVSRVQADLARLHQNLGDLEVKQEEVKANYQRQVLSELQETSQRLLDIDATLGTARQLRYLRAQKVGFGGEELNYTMLITRAEQSGTVTINATTDTKLEPGDIIEVKLNRRDPIDSPATEAALNPQKAPAERSFVASGRQRLTTAPAVYPKTHSTYGDDSAPKTTSRERCEQQSSASANVEATEGQHAISPSDARTGNTATGNTALAPHTIMPWSLPPAVDAGHGKALLMQKSTAQGSVPLPTRQPSKETFNVIKSKRADVKAIQQSLLSNGYSLTVDGRIGPQTLGAIADALAGIKNKSADGDAGMSAQDLRVSGLQ